jgi:hypothetical protein
MSGSRHERCCPPTEPCPECLAYYAWLNRDLDPKTSNGEDADHQPPAPNPNITTVGRPYPR